MTFEQLAVFIAVAEREHLTNAARAIGLTPSAVSASIKTLENFYNVQLFQRVGRRIELTGAGREFLDEAKAIVARVRTAELVLSEMGQLHRGTLDIHASQTIASYWLPARLMQFREAFPGIALHLTVGNTQSVAHAVADGLAEIGFIEGDINNPVLATNVIAEDQMVVLARPDHPLAQTPNLSARTLVAQTQWITREAGSGTRTTLEAALAAQGGNPEALHRALILPSNEAVLTALIASPCAAAVSLSVAKLLVEQKSLCILDFALPHRTFVSVRHKERQRSHAVHQLEAICAGAFSPPPIQKSPPSKID